MTKKFKAVTTNSGVVLCEEQDGAFLNLRNPQDLKNLQDLVSSLMIVEVVKAGKPKEPGLLVRYMVATDDARGSVVSVLKLESDAQEYAEERPGLKVIPMRQIPDDEL